MKHELRPVAFLLFPAILLASLVPLLGQPIFVERLIAPRPQPLVKEPAGQVAELISQLSEESPRTRENAVRRLLEMEPGIEPQVRGALRHEVPQTNFPFIRRTNMPASVELIPTALLPRYKLNELDELISHLEEQRRLTGSVITLHYKHTPAADMLRDLSVQADADVRFGSWYGLAGPDWCNTNQISVDLDHATYWDALRVLQNSCEIAAVAMNGQNRLVFAGCPPFQRPGGSTTRAPSPAVSGPFQIIPISADLNRHLEYGMKAKSAVVKLTMEALAEPKLGDLGLRAVLRVKRCLDDHGRPLVLAGTNTFPTAGSSLGGRWTLLAEVAEPQPGRRIKTFEGELCVAIGPPQRYLAMTNLLVVPQQSREFDGMVIAVQRVAQSTQAYEANFTLSAPEGSPYAVSFTEGDPPNIGVWDEALRQLDLRNDLFVGYQGVHRANGRDVWTWRVSATRPPVALTWLTPAETRWITVPFALHDLPFP